MLSRWDSQLFPWHSRGAWRALEELDNAHQLCELFPRVAAKTGEASGYDPFRT